MAMHAPTSQQKFEPKIVQRQTEKLTTDMIQTAVDRAGRRLAPLWSLRHFVAVNPYLGWLEQTFEQTAATLAQRANVRTTAPRAFYADAIQSGRITDADLEAALQESDTVSGAPETVDALKAFAMRDTSEMMFETTPTVAGVASDMLNRDWQDFVTETISSWAGSYFDQGQSYWKSPWADLPPFAAWRAEAVHDRTPEVSGIIDFGDLVAGPLVCDLAVACAYLVSPDEPDPFIRVTEAIAAYLQVQHLDSRPLALLPGLIACRQAMTLLIQGYRVAQGQDRNGQLAGVCLGARARMEASFSAAGQRFRESLSDLSSPL